MLECNAGLEMRDSSEPYAEYAEVAEDRRPVVIPAKPEFSVVARRIAHRFTTEGTEALLQYVGVAPCLCGASDGIDCTNSTAVMRAKGRGAFLPMARSIGAAGAA
jgi:hypothetical protein